MQTILIRLLRNNDPLRLSVEGLDLASRNAAVRDWVVTEGLQCELTDTRRDLSALALERQARKRSLEQCTRSPKLHDGVKKGLSKCIARASGARLVLKHQALLQATGVSGADFSSQTVTVDDMCSGNLWWERVPSQGARECAERARMVAIRDKWLPVARARLELALIVDDAEKLEEHYSAKAVKLVLLRQSLSQGVGRVLVPETHYALHRVAPLCGSVLRGALATVDREINLIDQLSQENKLAMGVMYGTGVMDACADFDSGAGAGAEDAHASISDADDHDGSDDGGHGDVQWEDSSDNDDDGAHPSAMVDQAPTVDAEGAGDFEAQLVFPSEAEDSVDDVDTAAGSAGLDGISGVADYYPGHESLLGFRELAERAFAPFLCALSIAPQPLSLAPCHADVQTCWMWDDSTEVTVRFDITLTVR
jgi:hypothetical protein